MVLGLYLDAQSLEGQEHFGPQILKLIHGRHRKVAFLEARFVTQIRAFCAPGVPGAFHRVDFIEGALAVGLKADIVKNKKFGFGAQMRYFTDTGML